MVLVVHVIECVDAHLSVRGEINRRHKHIDAHIDTHKAARSSASSAERPRYEYPQDSHINMQKMIKNVSVNVPSTIS